MSLRHSFGLIEGDFEEYFNEKVWRRLARQRRLPPISDPIELHDDLLFYIHDSLQWIECYNPHKGEAHFGLNLYGETIILPSSSSHAAAVFEGWANLFRLGREQLELRGHFMCIVGSPKLGHYEKLAVDRHSIVDTLLRLADQCRKAEKLVGKGFILHSGI